MARLSWAPWRTKRIRRCASGSWRPWERRGFAGPGGAPGSDLPEEEEAARNLAVARLGLRGITQPTSINHLVAALAAEEVEARLNAAYYFGRNEATTPWAGSASSVRVVLDSLPPSDPTAMHLLLGLSLLGATGDNPRFLAWLRGISRLADPDQCRRGDHGEDQAISGSGRGSWRPSRNPVPMWRRRRPMDLPGFSSFPRRNGKP